MLKSGSYVVTLVPGTKIGDFSNLGTAYQDSAFLANLGTPAYQDWAKFRILVRGTKVTPTTWGANLGTRNCCF